MGSYEPPGHLPTRIGGGPGYPEDLVAASELRTRCIMAADSFPGLWSLNTMTNRRFLELIPAAFLEEVSLRLHSSLEPVAPLARSRRLREYVFSRLAALLERPC